MVRNYKKRAVMLTIVIGVCSAVIALSYYIHYKNSISSSVIPEVISSQVDFPLYEPTNMPEGMSVDKTSFSADKDVVMYAINYDKQKIVISIMPISSKPDVNQFNPTRTFTSRAGKVYIAKVDKRTSAAIINAKSWLLINSEDDLDDSSMDAFINSLRLLK